MKNHKRSLRWVPSMIVLWAIFGGQGCLKKTFEDSSDVQGNVAEGSDYLWPNATASVCWENNLPQADWDKYAPLRTKIAEFVTSQMARAGFTLNGWQTCGPNSKGIRVAQRIPAPNDTNSGGVIAFGRRLDGLFAGATVVMYEEPNLGPPAALHEFGHAIGMRHEANRLDSPCAKDQTAGMSDESEGALPQGAYDRDSIMNYCKQTFGFKSGLLIPLSPGDIATIKALYSGPAKFPHEESCRKDGHSWVSAAMKACCRLAPGQSATKNAQYPVCLSDNPTAPVSSDPVKLPEPVGDISITRLASAGFYWTVVKSPFPNPGWVLSCNENEYIGKDQPLGELREIQIVLEQAAGLGRDTFTCSHIDSYDLAAGSKGIDPTRKMARLTFASPIVIKVNQEPSKVDNSKLPWKYFDNVQAAPTTSPVVGQPTQKPDPISTKLMNLYFEGFPMGMAVEVAYLKCGSEKVSGQAVLAGSVSGDVAVRFTVPSHLSCDSTELAIIVPKAPNKEQSSQESLATKEFHRLALKFDKTIDLKSQKAEFIVVIQVPKCLSINSTQRTSISTPPKTTPQPAPASSSCDMSKSKENNGYGWDNTKKEPCKEPVSAPQQPTSQPAAASQQAAPASSSCDMSQAAANQGWGYDHTKKESCK